MNFLELFDTDFICSAVRSRYSEDELKAKLLELADKLGVDLTPDAPDAINDGAYVETSQGTARAVVITPEEAAALSMSKRVYERLGL